MLPDTNQGLDENQVLESRKKFGLNKLPEQKRFTLISIFVNQLKSPLIIILILASIVTLALELPHKPLNEIPEFFAIIGVVFINTFLGFIQEFKAESTLEALKSSLVQTVKVIREGRTIEVPSEDLVVGDLVKIKFGDKITADGVLVENNNISVNEAAITGESAPVYKFKYEGDEEISRVTDNSNLLKMGTNILSGFGKYVVTKVGIETEFGKITEKVVGKEDAATPLQRKLDKLSKQMAFFVIGASFIVFIIGLLNQLSPIDIFEISVALAVSAVPEALVISLTVVLTVGMTRLLRKKALVRKLIVAETLGSVSTICIDKTGTITFGIMKVQDIETLDKPNFIKALYYNNNDLNSVDKAVRDWIQTKEFKVQLFQEKVSSTLPFDSKNKFSLAITENNLYAVGAPDILLEKSVLPEDEKKEWEKKIEAETANGSRILGVAYRFEEDKKEAKKESLKDMKWLGYVVIIDPIRHDVKDVLLKTIESGIKIKIITGDHKNTARHVLSELGLTLKDSELMSGEELRELSKEELIKRIGEVKLFYRTNPEQKYLLVETLQELGESVAMMGDGVNDAPALKKADVGIVVENATDVSKETADIVLLDSNFKTIIAAIEEGRSIFTNMKKIITYILSDSFGELILIGGSIILGLQTALIPLQILYINIIADGLPDLALSFEPKEQDILSRKPISSKSSIFDKEMIYLIAIIGFVVNLLLLGTYFLLSNRGYDINHIRSVIFAILSLNTLLYIFSIKSLSKNIWEYNIFNNMTLNFSVLAGFSFVVISFAVKPIRDLLELQILSNSEVIYVIVLVILNVVLIEFIKLLFKKRILH